MADVPCLIGYMPDDYLLSEQMTDRWTSFTKFGYPYGPCSKSTWKPSTRRKHYFQVMDTPPTR
jgi:hypothetical protein